MTSNRFLTRVRRYLIRVVLVSLALSPTLGSAQGNPGVVGRWDAPIRWPIIGIHAAVLPTGWVFHLTYEDPVEERGTLASLWNPSNGKFIDVTPGFGSMFCSGQNFLPTGELFIAGGYDPTFCLAEGVTETYVFNPFELSWRKTGSMKSARFYPTVIAQPDGRQLIIGGQGDVCQFIPTMEIFDLEHGLSRVRGPNRIMRDYPRAFLLSTGEIVQVLPEPETVLLNKKKKFWKSIALTRLARTRYEAAGFYIPGRTDNVMICGGYLVRDRFDLEDPVSLCETIDLSASAPVWRDAAPMNFPRGDSNAVLLPDGKVLIVGGGEAHRYDSPNLRPEMYDPETGIWTLMAPETFGRMYHSTAVLLPDGRVLSAGQDDDSADGRVSGAWGEVFSPPYLFNGKRPAIRTAPAEAGYGAEIEIKVTTSKKISKVVLIGLSAVTHSTNVGQRYVPLEFDRTRQSKLSVSIVKNANLAPPGYYMLFAVNDKGVPSVAKMIHIS